MIFSSSIPTGTPAFFTTTTYTTGSTVIAVTDTCAKLAAWESARAAGVTILAFSTNIQASGGSGVSVSGINAGTGAITLGSGTNGALLANQPVILYMQRTIASTITPARNIVMASAPTNNMIPGSEIVGSGWKTNTHTSLNFASNNWLSLNIDKSPTQTITSGSSVWMCHAPMKLNAAVVAGASSLPFAQTTYTNRLLLVRINFSANFPTTYQGPGTDWGAAINYGLPLFMGGSCNPVNDSVLSPSLATNTGGGCNSSPTNPIYSVQLETPLPVLSMMVAGDSKFQGSTTPYNSMNFVTLAAADMWSPQLPTSPINCAWAGGPGALFVPVAKDCLKWTKPGMVVIEGIANNWPSSVLGYAQALSSTEGLAAIARGQGALAVLTDNYPGATFGLNTLGTINPYQVLGRTYLSQYSASGRPYFDTTSVPSAGGIGAIFGGNAYIASQYTGDGLHLLLQGHQALVPAFEKLIAPYAGKP